MTIPAAIICCVIFLVFAYFCIPKPKIVRPPSKEPRRIRSFEKGNDRQGAACNPGYDEEFLKLLQKGENEKAIQRYSRVCGTPMDVATRAVENWLSMNKESGVKPAPQAPTSVDCDPSVLEAIRAGKKINAIKLYREIYRVGLKEAKEEVERISDNLPRP